MNCNTVPLCSVAQINPTLGDTALEGDELVNFVPMAAIDADKSVISAQEVRPLADVRKGYTSFADGDILVAKITPCFENGKISQIRVGTGIGFGSTEFHVIRPQGEKLDGRYLVQLLRQDRFRIDGERRMTGSGGQRRVPKNYLETLPVPLPSLPEQQRIASILDKADALRAKRRKALAELDRFTHSVFIDMFGDPVANPKNWPVFPIASVGDVITGNTPPRANPANYGDAIEWIKSDNLNNPNYFATTAEERLSDLGKLRARTAPPFSILVTCIAGSPDCIGNSAMIDREVAFNQQINAFIPTSGNPHFFYALFRVGKRLIQAASTNGMKGLVSKGRFEKIEVIVPPRQLQNKFAEIALATEQQMEAQRKSLGELDTLFASLQYQAFHGELSA